MVKINWVIVFQFLSNDMQIIHGLFDRVMEKNGVVPFVSPVDKSGYYIERSDVSAKHCIGVVSFILFCL